MEIYETIKVSFTESISNIDRMFDDVEKWGVSNLKEWIESYETSRFTQIGEDTAIITSEYNMDFLKEWLRTHIEISKMRELK